jgi:ABC-type polysaccharide/polyol phosphate export permease
VSITSSRGIIRRVYVPKAVFPLSAVLSNLISFGFSLVPLLLMMVAVRAPIKWSLLTIFIPAIEVAAFAFGIGMMLATLHVFFRDVRWFYDSALLAGFYITPVFHTPEVVGPEYQRWIELNPLYPMLRAFRDPVVFGRAPRISDLAAGAAFAAAAIVMGGLILRRYEQRIIGYL